MTGMGLLQRSLYGGVLILVVLAVRALLLGRLPKRTFPILWAVVLVRLLLPVSFSSVLSIYSFLQPEQRAESSEPFIGEAPVQEAPEGPSAWAAVQGLAFGEGVSSPSAPGKSLLPPDSVLFTVWCVGAGCCAVWFGLAYFRSLWSFRKAEPVEDAWIRRWQRRHRLGYLISIRQSDRISAPLTYGSLRPVILLPQEVVWGSRPELEYVLQHEYVHICHSDATVKLAMVAALCIHWFNPLVWLMSGLLNRDIELACDESVLRRFGERSRAGYAMALIGLEEKKRGLLPLYNGFSKNATEERIKLIMKYRKMTYMMGVSALLLVLCVVLVFATSAKKARATGDPADISVSGSAGGMENELMDPPSGGADSGMDARNLTNDPEGGAHAAMTELSGGGQEEYVISYMQEGMPAEEPAVLYAGKGYCILIPKEGWQSYAPDAWAWSANEQVQVWVSDFSGSTWEQAAASLEADGYVRTEEDGVLEKESDGRLFTAELRRSGSTVMCLNYTYPSDSEHVEGFYTLMSAIAVNFAMVPEGGGGELSEELSEDGRQMEQTARAFWQAYSAGNVEAVEQYLAKGYSGEIEVFPDGVDGHVADEAAILAVKGLDVGDKAVGETCEIWVEIRPAASADYYEYLTLEMVKEQDGWKVRSYGLGR